MGKKGGCSKHALLFKNINTNKNKTIIKYSAHAKEEKCLNLTFHEDI